MRKICDNCIKKAYLDGFCESACIKCGQYILSPVTPGPALCEGCLADAAQAGVYLCRECGEEIKLIPNQDSYNKVSVVGENKKTRLYLRKAKRRSDKHKRRIIKILQTKKKPDEKGVSDQRKLDKLNYED